MNNVWMHSGTPGEYDRLCGVDDAGCHYDYSNYSLSHYSTAAVKQQTLNSIPAVGSGVSLHSQHNSLRCAANVVTSTRPIIDNCVFPDDQGLNIAADVPPTTQNLPLSIHIPLTY